MNEEEIRILLAFNLKARGLSFNAERTIPNSQLRYDLGVVSEGHLIALIEVKTDSKSSIRDAISRQSQSRAYHKSGLPWRYCVGEADISETTVWAVGVYKSFTGKLPECDKGFLKSLEVNVVRQKNSFIGKRHPDYEKWQGGREQRLALVRGSIKELGILEEPLPF